MHSRAITVGPLRLTPDSDLKLSTTPVPVGFSQHGVLDRWAELEFIDADQNVITTGGRVLLASTLFQLTECLFQTLALEEDSGFVSLSLEDSLDLRLVRERGDVLFQALGFEHVVFADCFETMIAALSALRTELKAAIEEARCIGCTWDGSPVNPAIKPSYIMLGFPMELDTSP